MQNVKPHKPQPMHPQNKMSNLNHNNESAMQHEYTQQHPRNHRNKRLTTFKGNQTSNLADLKSTSKGTHDQLAQPQCLNAIKQSNETKKNKSAHVTSRPQDTSKAKILIERQSSNSTQHTSKPLKLDKTKARQRHSNLSKSHPMTIEQDEINSNDNCKCNKKR